MTIILDTGALIALDRGDREVFSRLLLARLGRQPGPGKA